MRVLLISLALTLALPGCGWLRNSPDVPAAPDPGDLYPGETPEMRRLIRQAADFHDIPEALLHRVIQRESDYRADARNGPYYGLMQILPETARGMGYDGTASGLLDAETNLRWAGAYLRGAWIVSDGDIDEAVGWYARGYYYEARDRCLLVETGLRDREVRRDC
jgi:hypothetical protein